MNLIQSMTKIYCKVFKVLECDKSLLQNALGFTNVIQIITNVSGIMKNSNNYHKL